jgi:putative transposase
VTVSSHRLTRTTAIAFPPRSSDMPSGCTICSASACGNVELLLAERGVVVSYEAIRRWCKRFGRSFANRLRRRRPGDRWHLLPDVEQRQSRYLNNRAENSHRPTRHRERQMQRFKSPEQAQDFLSAHAFIRGHFHPRRHLLAADAYRVLRSVAFEVWHHETCVRHAT